MYKTTNFSKETDQYFSCPCCGEGGLSLALLIVLEELRKHFNAPVTITSGARCKEHNQKVGGAKNSEHLTTADEPLVDAADVSVKGVSPTKVAVHLKSLPYANLLGIGKYSNWVHIDVRGYGARW
jgi:uncharacterized protein YcbK (DUF882 family)